MGTWSDLDRELRRMLLLAHAEDRDVTATDILTVVARWIGIPTPRVSPEDRVLR